jgi:NAD(P)-dependent dehydrogenase (short-subunit alcohol dehydrogenase family)
MNTIGRDGRVPSPGRLTGKVAVITGASTGIGASTAELFVAEGARVALMSRDADRLRQTAAALGGEDRVLAVSGDVSRPGDVDRLMTDTVDRFGGVDVVVSNAGIHRITPFTQIEDGEWSEMIATNLTGTFLVCRATARNMIARGRGGSIVLTSSTNGLVAEQGMAHYNASKGALVMLARSMAVDLAPYGIRVNAVAPGTILSEITRPMVEAGFPFGEIPLGRIGQPEEVAAAILFLASDDASYITGEILVVDGGQIALNGAAVERAPGKAVGPAGRRSHG